MGMHMDEDDKVNHPKHYTSHPSGVECITVVEHMSFNMGNAIKYLWRADEKGASIEDLKKARWYVDREIERREKWLARTVPLNGANPSNENMCKTCGYRINSELCQKAHP